jgi:hypothetical protein
MKTASARGLAAGRRRNGKEAGLESTANNEPDTLSERSTDNEPGTLFGLGQAGGRTTKLTLYLGWACCGYNNEPGILSQEGGL